MLPITLWIIVLEVVVSAAPKTQPLLIVMQKGTKKAEVGGTKGLGLPEPDSSISVHP